jgi:uncharacterized protein (UPF0212 family)
MWPCPKVCRVLKHYAYMAANSEVVGIHISFFIFRAQLDVFRELIFAVDAEKP